MAVFVKRNRFPITPYKVLDYIESTGTQYIDTGFIPNQDSRVIMEVRFPIQDTHQYIFGARTTATSNTYGFGEVANSYYRDHYNTGYDEYSAASIDDFFIIDKNKNVTTIDGAYTITNTYTTFTSPVPMTLFGINHNGEIQMCAIADMAWCKIYDNDVLIRDYIPVQLRKTGEVGLWDKVNRVFYGNAGTGKFIGVKDNIPVIQSTGTQYVDTEFKPNQKTKVVMDAQWDNYTALTITQTYFRCKDSTNTFGVMDPSSVRNLLYYYYQKVYSNTWDVPVGKRRTIIVDGASATMDGTTLTYTAQTFQLEVPLFLFASNENGTANYIAKGKIFSCQIYDNAALTRDYIPFKMPDGSIGLWDKVERKFYGNAGSGKFLEGEIAA